jgi:uncharacterized nucleotidyltransferase DUF6036
MRELADAERIRRFMHAVGAAATEEGAVYFTGGATAVLLGWRASTLDVDILPIPEQESLLRAIPKLKDDLSVNVELASPHDFVPVPSGWEDRSIFAAREGRLSFYHFDPYGQALAKLERGHAQDLDDVRELVARALVEPGRALQYLAEIEGELYRYPAIDPSSFRRRVENELLAR